MPEHVEGTESPPWKASYEWMRNQRDAAIAERDEVRRQTRTMRESFDSLLTEREELREALAEIEKWATSTLTPMLAMENIVMVLNSVLSSRETTDSPRCPTCGSDDPNVRGTWYAIPNSCTDPFHATTEGTSEMSDPTTPPLPGGPIATIRRALEPHAVGACQWNGPAFREALNALDLLSELVRAAWAVDAEEWSGREGDPSKNPVFISAMASLERALLPFETSTDSGKDTP